MQKSTDQEISLSQVYKSSALLEFFIETNNIIDKFPEMADKSNMSESSKFIQNWITSSNDDLVEYLTNKLIVLSQGLVKESLPKERDTEGSSPEKEADAVTYMGKKQSLSFVKNQIGSFLDKSGRSINDLNQGILFKKVEPHVENINEV